jgi:hypothetical protein
MLQKELQKLTNFIAGEAAILETRPSKLEEAFTDLFEKGSVLDAEIPDPEKDDEAIEQKIQRIISELKNGSTDKESLNLAAYYFTAPNLNLGWNGKRIILSSIASAIKLPRYRSTVRNLVYGYVQFFDPNSRTTDDVARLLTQHQEKLNRRWNTRISQFRMLDASNLLDRISGEVVKELPLNFFDRVMSLPRTFDASNLKLLSLRKSCEQLASLDQEQGLHHHFLDAYVSEQKLQRNAASYLLEPIIAWFKSPEQPDSPLKERVQSLILNSFGDPRMQGGANSWPPLYQDKDGQRRKACQDELTRWLTKDTLRLFFKAIKKTADTSGSDSAALRHWPQRQAFWERYLDQGYIDQAWVVLGSRVSEQLESLSSDDGLDVIKYGQFAIADNAAIIMRIGESATVVEWSHNGAVWVCPNNHGAAPKMFSTQIYEDSELRSPRNDARVSRITHDVNHSWRPKLDSAIHDLTGIQLRDRHHAAFTTRR